MAVLQPATDGLLCSIREKGAAAVTLLELSRLPSSFSTLS